MATQIYVNLLENQNIMYLDKHRSEEPDILVVIPGIEGTSENERHPAQQNGDNRCHADKYTSNRQSQKIKPTERMGDMSTRIQDQLPIPAQDSRYNYHVYKRNQGDIYMKYEKNGRGHSSERSQTFPKEDRNNNNNTIMKVVIDNLRTLPSSGKLEIIIKLPSICHENSKSVSADDHCTPKDLGSQNELHPGPKVKSCTCRNLAASLFDVKAPANSSPYLNIPEMRPRSYSDSKIQVRRPQGKRNLAAMSERRKQRLEGQNSSPVPQITVQDFSDRRKDLQSRLKDESDELKKDLIDSAEFVSQINCYRKRLESKDD
ncbi:uncharacterized protein LOC117339659 [Pecten maximus]|uniref:uncharacterized protein LOC117339659 n=1 Tax=Pecten maximus TaxID=6579 RepID=UPI001457EA8D|nr:uncharacterized protein LOC117339659 [Pecten maximus]